MTQSMLKKVDNYDAGTGDIYDDIVECCLTYEDLAKLFQELLEYFSGAYGWDDEAFELVQRMYENYLAE